MILTDINGGLYSVYSIVPFLDNTIVIEVMTSDHGKGFNIIYKDFDVTIRIYKPLKDSQLSSKHIISFSDEEISSIVTSLLMNSMAKLNFTQLIDWIRDIKTTSYNQAEYDVKRNIRIALGF